MKRLGELLLERGAIAVGELHTALEACHRNGGRLGTHLLRYGFIDEAQLLEALGEQLGVAAAPSASVETVPASVRALVPTDVQRRLGVVPLRQRDGVLVVAMVNPRDLAALEELAAVTGQTIRAEVATEAAIAAAHDRLGAVAGESRPSAPAPVAPHVPDPSGWEALWRPPRVPAATLRAHEIEPEPIAVEMALASYPELTPVLDTTLAPHDAPLEEDAFVRLLQQAPHRDTVGELLLAYAIRFVERAVLFAVHRDRVLGWMARGEGLALDDVQAVSIPVEAPSLFLNLARGGAYSLSALPPGEANRAVGDLLQGAAELLVVPVRVKERAVAFLVAAGEAGTLGPAVPELVTAASRSGIAFEIIILRSKIRV